MDLDRYLSLIIIFLLALGVLSIIYIIVNPQPSEKFTEFYVLGADGKAGNYPVNLTRNETGKITIGVVNQEYKTVDYLVVVKLDNRTFYKEEFTLPNKQKKEIAIKVVTSSPGSQKLEMFLYKLPDTTNPYRYLFLQMNVSD